jgi:hypothetical protein
MIQILMAQEPELSVQQHYRENDYEMAAYWPPRPSGTTLRS